MNQTHTEVKKCLGMRQAIFAIFKAMQKRLTSQRLINWIAAIAILFAALSGSVGQVFAKAADDTPLTAVCTSTGMKFIPTASLDSESVPGDSRLDANDCPYCSFNHFSVGYIQERHQFDHSAPRQACELATHSVALAVAVMRLPPSRAPPRAFC
jgi:hypothetical protein